MRCRSLLFAWIFASLINPVTAQTVSRIGTGLDPGGPDTRPFRIFGSGEHRLIIDPAGRRLLFGPTVEVGEPGTLFTDPSGTWRLRGTRGDYLLIGPDGARRRLEVGRVNPTAGRTTLPAAANATDCPVDCDASTHAPPSSFMAGADLPGARRLDLRPASCRSYFTDYAPLQRGSNIESAMIRQQGMPGMTATVRSFPLVDWFDDERIVVLHSRDLASESLDAERHPNALFDRLMSDGRAIRRHVTQRLQRDGHMTASDGGSVTRLEAVPARRVVLTLLVRHGIASASQREQIRNAHERLQQRFGIDLQIIEIP